jgi:Na+-transporting NADH:ubiquinone oxidoreductase subunit NqrE
MRRARNPNHGIAASIAAVAFAAIAATFTFEPVPPGLPGLGAVEFPRLVSAILLLLALILGLTAASPANEEEAPRISSRAWLIFAICLGFLPLVDIIGMIPAIPIFLLVAGLLWGGTPWPTLVLSALGMGIAIWLVFVKIFRLTLPKGWLGSMLGF